MDAGNVAAVSELLALNGLAFHRERQTRVAILKAAQLFVEKAIDLQPASSAALVELLFKFGHLQLAEQVARRRQAQDLAPTAFDHLAISYRILAEYDFRTITPASHEPLYPPDVSRKRIRVLSFLYTTPAFQQNGYTVRTASILTNTSLDVIPFGRIGYPWISNLLRNNQASASIKVDSIEYHHRRGDIVRQTEVFRNLSFAKHEIKKIISELRPDVVHAASNFNVGLPALLAARECRLPFVYEMRGIWEHTAGVGIDDWDQSERFKLERKLETFVASAADRIITLTETQKSELVTRGGIAADKVDVVTNFFGAAPQVDGHSDFIADLKLQLKGKRVLGYIGSIVNYEGLQDLVEVLSRDNNCFEHVVLLIIGDGPFLNQLKTLVAAKGLEDGRVLFTGRVSRADADAAYTLIDVCVLPRIDHPVTQLVSPLKLVEILAMGKILLASDVRAVAERIENLGFGELFKTGDLEHLEHRLVQILSSLSAFKARYRRAKAHILAQHTWKQGAFFWDNSFRTVVEKWQKLASDESAGTNPLRFFLPAIRSERRQRCNQLVRVARASPPKIPNAGLTLTMRSSVNILPIFLDENHTACVIPFRVETRGNLAEWTGKTPHSRGNIFFYVEKEVVEDANTVTWALRTSTGEVVPLALEDNRIHAVIIHQERNRDERFIAISKYAQSIRFAMSVIPLNNATIDTAFERIPFSQRIGARYNYLSVQPGENVIPLNNGVAGSALYEFTPWQDGFRGSYNGLIKTDLAFAAKSEKSYFIDLARDKHNVFVIARINENLIDGSVIWLKTLVSSLSSNPSIHVYVATNAILIPNSITAALFSRPNVTKIDLESGDTRDQTLADLALIIDRVSGGFDTIIVRGEGIARAISSRSMRRRLILYAAGLITPQNVKRGRCTDQKTIELMRAQNGLIFQNNMTRDIFRRSCPNYGRACYVIPPSVETAVGTPPGAHTRERCIVYAGKLIREYGILELLDAFSHLSQRRKFRDLKLVILGSKFDARDPTFQDTFLARVTKLGSRLSWIPAASPESTLKRIQEARVVWGWREGHFETSHFEVSTKMVEAISCGTPIILFPSSANVALLGRDYEGFTDDPTKTTATLQKLLTADRMHFAKKFQALAKRYSAGQTYSTLVHTFSPPTRKKAVIIAAHDFKFVEDIEGQLLANGHRVFRQFWRNHSQVSDYGERFAVQQADVVHCEWCLGNAVWWSKNIPAGKRLTIRFHRQELTTDYPHQINYSSVHKVLFVSPYVMREAIEKFKIPSKICQVVPISVALHPRAYTQAEMLARRNELALVGFTPWLKRPDLALELFVRLKRKYPALRLTFTGHTPSSYPWMKDRPTEIDAYHRLFEKLASDRETFRDVTVSEHTDRMQDFYERVGWVLSTSDIEGCHTAVAEGGIAGCLPLILNWQGADEVYPPRYVRTDLDGLVAAFDKMYGRFEKESKAIQSEFSKMFALEKVYEVWSNVLDLNSRAIGSAFPAVRPPRRFKIIVPKRLSRARPSAAKSRG